MSVRTEIADMFATDWADIPELAGVRVVATERALDDIQVPTALLRIKSVGRSDAAPNSHRNYRLTLTLISAHTDMDRAADELDELVDQVLRYLDTRIKYDPAEVVGYDDRLAFDIPLTILASKD